MKIPAEFFYDNVMKSVLFDIRDQTGKQLTQDQLKNFSYIKTFSKNSSAKFKIEKIEKNKTYHYRTSTTANDYTVQYDILYKWELVKCSLIGKTTHLKTIVLLKCM